MGILDKLKPHPRWKHTDPAVRLEAVRELDDQVELAELAGTDPDARVRRAAVARLDDVAALGAALNDTDEAVKDDAAERLVAIALDGSDAARALAAAGHLTDARRLAHLAKSPATQSTEDVRTAALARITDDRALGAVARHAAVEAIASAAAARLTSSDEQLDTVLNSDHKDVALSLFDRVIDAANPDQALLRTIEARAQQKAVSKRARTMLQTIEEAEQARRAAEEERRRQEALLCDAVEGAATVVDADRSAADLARLESAWQALGATDAAAAQRFQAGAVVVRGRIAEKRREIEAAAEAARQRGEALASREALCQRVETIEGDDILAQLQPIEEEWASLVPLVGNGPEANRLNERFAAAVASCRKRHALGAAIAEHRATLETLIVEAEALPAIEDGAAAEARWKSLRREAASLIDTLAGASRPATDLADRLAAVSRAFDAREAAVRDAAEKARGEVVARLQRLTERARRVAEAETVTLREGERLMRDIKTALDDTAAIDGKDGKDVADAAAALRAQQEAVAPRVKELRDMDEWRRFANAQQQEQLIAMAEAIVASLKADEEAGKTSELAATAKALREFHLRWQEVADAPRHSAQRLWDRFKTATDFIRSRCEVYFSKLREERGTNLERKQALVEEAEKLAESTDWAKTAQRFQDMQTEWQAIGPVPREAGKDLALRFRTASNTFFTRRRDDLSGKKKEWTDNLERKEALCARAEALAESTDWDAAAAEMKKLQADWKTIGPVRRNKSEQIWNRFRAAADTFFERYHNRHRIALQGKIAEYEALVVQLEGLDALEQAPDDLGTQVANLRATIQKNPPAPSDALKALQDRWKAALTSLTLKWPAAFEGTDLDPAAVLQRMQKLVAKIEGLVEEDAAPAAAHKSATELLAERLRSALASNAMGKRDDSKWRQAATTVDDARASWQRLAPLETEDARALEARFKAACKRVMDQVKLHVSAPVGGPGGGFGGGRPGGRPHQGPGSKGPGSRGPGSRGPGGPRSDRPRDARQLQSVG